ncbi:hypothetical protein B0T21DRAFT_280558 [Apiosordaria backusii]|uniref:Uncharacterized protein n=1 Tax=Apiosordaria backusii TaxID=314023 RepID=A0AA40ESJ0_9PEZI|nr:hypothetical protein B0T21DRAFT_280558 [Apiosordaria backusii]
MDRFNFFTGPSSRRNNNNNNDTNDTITDNTNTNTVTIRTAPAPRTSACNSSLRPPPGPHPATVENYNPYASSSSAQAAANPSPYGLSYPIYQSYDPRTSDDEHAPLSPRFAPNHDPESGQQQPQRLSFLARFPRPSFFGLRPPSSNYSGAGLRGAPPTVINNGQGNEEIESPKSPLFRIGEQQLPSTRLHLPNLERTWTGGSNGPPTRPGTTARNGQDNDAAAGQVVEEPEPAVTRGHHRSRSGRSNSNRSNRRHRRNGSGRSNRSRSGEAGETREERRQRRRNRETRRRRTETDSSGSRTRSSRSGSSGSSGGSSRTRKPPKNFLFCFPWIKSRRIRTQILRCFVSGLFLILMLTVYLSLTLTKNITASEFTILLILIILFITIFFCHSLIKLCMLVVKSRNGTLSSSSSSSTGSGSQRAVVPEMMQHAPGGYAVPREPIRVVLARDEEAVGIESEATKFGPPAYGLWRESVRVDPDRFYWARNQAAAAEAGNSSEATFESTVSSDASSGGTGNNTAQSGSGAGLRRPPSYASDDGVSYVVEARPRSMAPPPLNGDDNDVHAAGLHPLERERQQRPSVWV